MKILKPEGNQLYTPIIKYARRDSIITAIGAIHVGLPSYYAVLQKEIDLHSFGFYEGIKPLAANAVILPEKEKYVAGISKLSSAYELMAKYMGFTTQKSKLCYGKSWQNPDMTLDELVNAASDNLLRKLSNTHEQARLLEPAYEKHPRELARMLSGLAMTLYKLYTFPFMSQIVSFTKMNDPVIVGKRNEKLFAAMQNELDSSDICVVYGSFHLHGLDSFLRKNNFKKLGEQWVCAWEIDTELSWWKSFSTIIGDLSKK